jgi:hypothetical protein
VEGEDGSEREVPATAATPDDEEAEPRPLVMGTAGFLGKGIVTGAATAAAEEEEDVVFTGLRRCLAATSEDAVAVTGGGGGEGEVVEAAASVVVVGIAAATPTLLEPPRGLAGRNPGLRTLVPAFNGLVTPVDLFALADFVARGRVDTDVRCT